jgi:tetratricopeptide (TPR) repeat protein
VESYDKIGGMVVYNSHVCAVVFNGPKPFIIDFSLRRYPQYHSWRTITDVEAAASFYNNIGSHHFIASDTPEAYEKAKTYFNMAMKLQPDFVQAYNNMGVLYMRQDNREMAEKMYRKALKIKPGYFAAYSNLGNIYTSRGEIEKAIVVMKEAIKAAPDNPYGYMNLARIYLAQEDYGRAEEMLIRTLKLNERYTEARHMLGRLYLRQGRGADAKRQFALALKFQPDDDLAINKMDLIERLSISREQSPPK